MRSLIVELFTGLPLRRVFSGPELELAVSLGPRSSLCDRGLGPARRIEKHTPTLSPHCRHLAS